MNVVLTDSLPAGFTYVDPAGATTQSWNLGDMPFGDSETVTYSVVVGGDVTPGTYVNFAQVNATNYPTISDDEGVEIRAGEVLGFEELPETGGSTTYVPFLLLFALMATGAGMQLVRRRI